MREREGDGERPQVVFRTRGDHERGMGDVQGTLSLAAEFRRRGWRVSVIAEENEATSGLLCDGGMEHVAARGSAADVAVVRRMRPRVMVFNMLRNDPEYVGAFREIVDVLATVDDDGPAARVADVRINPLYPIADSHCEPSFVPLKDELQRENRRDRQWRTMVSRVIVTLGGADTYGFTPTVVRALGPVASDWEVEVVLGPAFEHRRELEEALEACPQGRWSIVRNVSDLPRRMAAADMGVCAGGLTLFEMACVGTPAVVVCGEPFEEATAARLAAAGFGCSLGFQRAPSEEAIRAAVVSLAGDDGRRREMGRRGRELVDGRGAARCCEEIIRRWEATARTF